MATVKDPSVAWDDHYAFMRSEWEPGQHMSLFGPTGSGKTHLVLKLLTIWPKEYPQLLIDTKEDDKILVGWGRRSRRLPSEWRRRMDREQKYRVVVPEDVAAIPEARQNVIDSLRTARREHDWVIWLNEVRALTDARPPSLGIGPRIESLWMRGRPHVTLIAETQRPAWVPGSMYDQPTHLYFGRILDGRSRSRIAEIGGDTEEIDYLIQNLGQHEFVYVNREDGFSEVVKAPK